MSDILNHLAACAKQLDRTGFTVEADMVDSVLIKLSSMDDILGLLGVNMDEGLPESHDLSLTTPKDDTAPKAGDLIDPNSYESTMTDNPYADGPMGV